ncbi:DUF4864 domain-containing protein [Roseibium litorale]|uniref:DUF4864 domain-containing protein n=1 Tax=Roseibium litorale TaxID=2803841 RepID=A0ABR9CJD6_9HYPH|nr:DUF4864 domain-containing protein [Roseibium litorale]MBD8890868.1 DUF4864 domain-containing protein [Roseibium litorale]
MRFIGFFCLWVLSAAAFGLAGNASAQEAAIGDSPAFQKIIRGQMNAFARGDAEQAFSFASRDLQNRFETPDFFMHMVRQGYQPVYRPRDVSFGAVKPGPQGPVQEVYVTGPDGNSWLALYSFEQQEDGSWKISGCYLTKSPSLSA